MDHSINSKKIAVLGQDERQMAVAEELCRQKNKKTVLTFHTIEAFIASDVAVDYVALPVGGLSEIEPAGSSWVESLDKRTVILAGRQPEAFFNDCLTHGIRVIQYSHREDFQIANAVPTAEGAIKLYMDLSKQTVDGRKMLVLGFGRCGFALALRLKALGGHITVFARKSEDLVLGRSMGLDIRAYTEFPKLIRQENCIFNTVPAMILDSSLLPYVPKDCRIIDIASSPGGTDFELCRTLGIDAMLAPNLPGRFFPKTAGKILADTIVRIIEENSSEINKGGL